MAVFNGSLHEPDSHCKARIELMAIKARRHFRGKNKMPTGTCFAGFEKVCESSLTPNVRKADKLRNSKYW